MNNVLNCNDYQCVIAGVRRYMRVLNKSALAISAYRRRGVK